MGSIADECRQKTGIMTKDALQAQARHYLEIRYLPAFRIARPARLSHNARMREDKPTGGTSAFSFAVIMERLRGGDRWATERWEAREIVPDAPAGDRAERVIHRDEHTETILFPGFVLRLDAVEAEGYYMNITSPRPKVFVMWRMDGEIARPEYITASYSEGVGWADSGENVDSVVLPEDLLPHIAKFVTEHYRPEAKREPRYATSKDKGVASRR